MLAKMAPHPAVLKIDTKHKCSGVLAYATILDPSWPCSLLYRTAYAVAHSLT